MWRNMRSSPIEVSRAGAHQETPGVGGISISITQQCQTALPLQKFTADEVTVMTVTSQRPGVAAQVLVGANLNSPDGSYHGPTTTVGEGQFTATGSDIEARFVVLPAAGWPVLGVGAVATWADEAPDGAALTYELLCLRSPDLVEMADPVDRGVARPFGPRTRSTPPARQQLSPAQVQDSAFHACCYVTLRDSLGGERRGSPARNFRRNVPDSRAAYATQARGT